VQKEQSQTCRQRKQRVTAAQEHQRAGDVSKSCPPKLRTDAQARVGFRPLLLVLVVFSSSMLFHKLEEFGSFRPAKISYPHYCHYISLRGGNHRGDEKLKEHFT